MFHLSRCPHTSTHNCRVFRGLRITLLTTVEVVFSAEEQCCEAWFAACSRTGWMWRAPPPETRRRRFHTARTCSCVERRFVRRVAKRTRPARSGCLVRHRGTLPALNIWQRPRKAVNRELHALDGNTSSSAPAPILPVQGSHSARPTFRTRISRKRTLDMFLAPEVTAGTCKERYSGRQDAFDELHVAGTLKGILHKEVSLFLVELSPGEVCRNMGENVPCPFCPWFRMKNSTGRLYWHVLHCHSAERHFTCSGTKKLRAVMSMYQCDLYRGRRQADYLRRSVVLIQSLWVICRARTG